MSSSDAHERVMTVPALVRNVTLLVVWLIEGTLLMHIANVLFIPRMKRRMTSPGRTFEARTNVTDGIVVTLVTLPSTTRSTCRRTLCLQACSP